jgi:membrane protease YdiL (CAAX protease family)
MNDTGIITPGLPAPPPEKRVWGGWATAGFGAVILFVLFLVMIVIMIIAAVIIAFSQPNTSFTIENFTGTINSYMGLLVSVSGIVAYIASTGMTLAFIKARGRAGIAEYLGLKRINWKTVLVLAAIILIYLGLTALVTGIFNVKDTDTKALENIYKTAVWPVLLWILVVILAPIAEETLFRGFLFEGFRRSRLGLVGTILVTSLVWTALHAGYSVSSLGAIFVIGLVMGVVRYKTGSLWSTMLMHALYNAVGMTMIALSIG